MRVTRRVSVHLVGTSTSCQPTPMSRNIAAHEDRAAFLPRAVGPDPSCGSGLQSCPRSPCDGVGGHRPALGRDGPALNRAAAAGLAHLIAASVERSASGPRPAPTARAQWASARRAARPQGAHPRVGPDRAGGGGHPRQARALLPWSTPLAWRRWPAPTAASHRDPTREAERHRVSAAAVGLPSWGGDHGSPVACGSAQRGVWPTGAGRHRVVHGRLSSVQAPHAARQGRSRWHGEQSGYARAPGAVDRAGGGRARGGSTELCPTATVGVPGRNRMARRAAACLVVDGGHGLGHRVCRAAVAPWAGGPGALG